MRNLFSNMTPPADPTKARNRKSPTEHYENTSSSQLRSASEATPLLPAATHFSFSYRRADFPNETIEDAELENQDISPNNFERRPILTLSGLEEEVVIVEDEDNEDDISDNPYLGGVSVTRFWLIYAGLLSNLVISHLRNL
jgi:hypothetical protein